MVLDHGRIIERARTTSFIAQKGEYYQLYTGAVELGVRLLLGFVFLVPFL